MFWAGLKKELTEEDLFEPLDEHASGKFMLKKIFLWLL